MRVKGGFSMICRLCGFDGLAPVNGNHPRDFYLCENCFLISVPESRFISREEEKSVYLSHENSIEHEGYVAFLNQAVEPALKYIHKTMRGLDYGCGYAKTLSLMLARAGYTCDNYDPFFAPELSGKCYDFIFSTEVFEHLCRPKDEIAKITGLLKPGGIFTVMTERWTDTEKFADWYYTRDPSHVAFYHDRTFDYLSKTFHLKRLFDDGKRVKVWRKEG